MPVLAPFPDNPHAVMLAGDWHGNKTRALEVIRLAAARGITVVLHLGDFGFWVPCAATRSYLDRLNTECVDLGVTLLWVDGNHECHPELLSIPLEDNGVRYIRSNIVHLPRGFRWTWSESTWMSLGGAHSVDTFSRIEGVSVWQEEHLSREDIENAIAGGPVDVMVTHDCPSGVDIPGLTPNAFPSYEIYAGDVHRAKLAEVVDAVQPLMLFHGHYHVKYTARRSRPSGGDTIIMGLADDMGKLDDNIAVINLDEQYQLT